MNRNKKIAGVTGAVIAVAATVGAIVIQRKKDSSYTTRSRSSSSRSYHPPTFTKYPDEDDERGFMERVLDYCFGSNKSIATVSIVAVVVVAVIVAVVAKSMGF